MRRYKSKSARHAAVNGNRSSYGLIVTDPRNFPITMFSFFPLRQIVIFLQFNEFFNLFRSTVLLTLFLKEENFAETLN